VDPSEETVRALYDAFARRDAEAAVALAHPAIEFWAQGTGERAGRSESYGGHEGLRQYFADLVAQWDELVIEPDEFRVAGTGVIVFGTVRGRAGGETHEGPVIWVWKLQGERVVYGRAVATHAEAVRVADA
jgi:ketosteroid isomerase-like protein